MLEIALRSIRLAGVEPLLDGEVPAVLSFEYRGGLATWDLAAGGRIECALVDDPAGYRLTVRLSGAAGIGPMSLGLRFSSVTGAGRYLRNGYQSWDGSWFAEAGTRDSGEPAGKQPTLGFAMTALLPVADNGAVLLGFERHDRFQTRFRFGGGSAAMTIDAETLLDGTGAAEGETLLVFDSDSVETALRRWSRAVAQASPLPPRVPDRRITGWCSWYNLYAAITEENILEHLAAARAFRDSHEVPLDIFLIDDGFTPEMGDWLDVKPQFPRGMAPLLREVEAAGFTPGLWLAPFLVGNRSKLFAEHPEWLVMDIETGEPFVHARFYGEFRWHKRSEEYHVLDITHPDAEAYMRRVLRVWRHEWGARYFKADFLLAGAEYGPDRVRWHRSGLSRIHVWRLMMQLIRDEIGESLLLGCGCPLWASVGLVDAVRIGRDIGVSWTGDYSAESLLRDLATRNHAAGILWQSDPDCLLLRDRFHYLSDAQVHSLALFAGLSGGVLMTSDRLDEMSEPRARLFADLLGMPIDGCAFPDLGSSDPVVRQVAESGGRPQLINLFNPTSDPQPLPDGGQLPPFSSTTFPDQPPAK